MDDFSEVQAILNDIQTASTQDAATEQEAPVAEVSATDAPIDSAAAASDEAEIADAADAADNGDAETEGDESEVADGEASPDAEAEAVDATDDDFQDLIDDIPSKETILKTHLRVPNAAKDDLVKFADGWRQSRDILNTIGGEKGAEVLKPFADVLLNPEVQPDATFKAWSSMTGTNEAAAFSLLIDGATNLLFTNDKSPAGQKVAAYGDVVLENRFGEGVNAEKIEKLLMLEKGGYINTDDDFQLLQQEGTGSALFQQQQSLIEQQQQKIDELTDLIKNPDKIVQTSVQEQHAVRDLDDELLQRLSTGVTPFRERGRWGAESALTQLTMKALVAELRDSPEYKDAVKFVKNYGALKQGDVIPLPLEHKLHTLVNKGKGRFGNEVIAINKELRAMAETSRNVAVKEQVKETKPIAESIKPQNTFTSNGMFDSDVEALIREYQSAVGR